MCSNISHCSENVAPRRLTSLAAFVGHVCRASPDMELTALLQYLVNQLRDGQSHDLVVLKELISTMTVRLLRAPTPVTRMGPGQVAASVASKRGASQRIYLVPMAADVIRHNQNQSCRRSKTFMIVRVLDWSTYRL